MMEKMLKERYGQKSYRCIASMDAGKLAAVSIEEVSTGFVRSECSWDAVSLQLTSQGH